MGSTFPIKRGLAAAALTAVAALSGCGATHSSAKAGTGPITTLAPAPSAPVATAPAPAGDTGATPATTPTTTSGAAGTTAAGSTAPKGCLAGQLEIDVGPADGAAGSVGYTNDFKNISATTCSLYGYPGLQMLNATGQPIPTDVIRAPSVSVPYVPEKLVTLAPGAQADFDMGFAASTGYGNAQCPTSTRVLFTAPNDFQSLTAALAIRPYGGGDVAQLHCGEVHVSPVYAGS